MMKKRLSTLTPEKQEELWHDFQNVREKLIGCCRLHPTMMVSRTGIRDHHDTLEVTCMITSDNAERQLRIYAALLCALLRGTHFETHKAYVSRISLVYYYVKPDWKYYYGEAYCHENENWVCLPPPEKAK